MHEQDHAKMFLYILKLRATFLLSPTIEIKAFFLLFFFFFFFVCAVYKWSCTLHLRYPLRP